MATAVPLRCLESIHELPSRFLAFQEYSDRSILSTHCPSGALNNQFRLLIDVYKQVVENLTFDQTALDACTEAVESGHVVGVTLGGKYLCSMQRLYSPRDKAGQTLSVAWDDAFDALQFHPKAEVRQSTLDFASMSVATLGEAFVVPVVMDAVKDKSYKVRYAAIRLAFTGGWASTIEPLQQLAKGDEIAIVRDYADFSVRLMLGGRVVDGSGYRNRGYGGTIDSHFTVD